MDKKTYTQINEALSEARANLAIARAMLLIKDDHPRALAISDAIKIIDDQLENICQQLEASIPFDDPRCAGPGWFTETDLY